VSYTEHPVETRTVTPCAEFPNDNPALHLGAIWVCLQATGPATCERPEAPQRVEVIAVQPEAIVVVEPEPIVLEAPEPSTDPVPPVLEAAEEEDDEEIEIVEDLVFDEVVDESPEPANAEGVDDPFVALGEVIEATARGAGASEAAIAALRVVLGRERVTADTSDELLVLREQAAAWQAILRGESEDFGACGVSSLDEWSALAIARTMGEMNRADGLRRELRRRGVAAFGLVIEAA
jgi:hypothetical protein